MSHHAHTRYHVNQDTFCISVVFRASVRLITPLAQKRATAALSTSYSRSPLESTLPRRAHHRQMSTTFLAAVASRAEARAEARLEEHAAVVDVAAVEQAPAVAVVAADEMVLARAAEEASAASAVETAAAEAKQEMARAVNDQAVEQAVEQAVGPAVEPEPVVEPAKRSTMKEQFAAAAQTPARRWTLKVEPSEKYGPRAEKQAVEPAERWTNKEYLAALAAKQAKIWPAVDPARLEMERSASSSELTKRLSSIIPLGTSADHRLSEADRETLGNIPGKVFQEVSENTLRLRGSAASGLFLESDTCPVVYLQRGPQQPVRAADATREQQLRSHRNSLKYLVGRMCSQSDSKQRPPLHSLLW